MTKPTAPELPPIDLGVKLQRKTREELAQEARQRYKNALGPVKAAMKEAFILGIHANIPVDDIIASLDLQQLHAGRDAFRELTERSRRIREDLREVG